MALLQGWLLMEPDAPPESCLFGPGGTRLTLVPFAGLGVFSEADSVTISFLSEHRKSRAGSTDRVLSLGAVKRSCEDLSTQDEVWFLRLIPLPSS